MSTPHRAGSGRTHLPLPARCGVDIDVDEGREPHGVLTPNVIALPEGGYRMYLL